MNYLGTKPTRYQLKIQYFSISHVLIEECPPLEGAMGDDK